MRIAIIGSGSIAEEHVRAIKSLDDFKHGDIEFAAVVGRRIEEAEEFARTHGFALGTTDLDRVLGDDRIDAALVTSPTDLHFAHTRQALLAGKHVLCEIPVATSLAETDELIALAESVDRRLMVCQTQRYFRPLIEARRRIEAGEITVHAAVSRYLFNRRNRINWKGRDRSWTDNLLWHHTCHAVDATLWLLGSEPVSVSGEISDPDPHTGIPMNVSVVLRTVKGQIATVVTSYHAMIPQHDYLLIGEESSLHFRDGELHAPAGIVEPKTGPDPLLDAMPMQNREFFDAIREAREPAVSARSVRPAMAVLQAIQDRLDDRLAT
jgi:2-hydroxy-4-carboxymuconate semialdehyde hemiacetal dehydrogenase